MTTKNFKSILVNRIANHDSHLLFLKHELMAVKNFKNILINRKKTFIEPDKLIVLIDETEIRLRECKKLLSLLSNQLR